MKHRTLCLVSVLSKYPQSQFISKSEILVSITYRRAYGQWTQDDTRIQSVTMTQVFMFLLLPILRSLLPFVSSAFTKLDKLSGFLSGISCKALSDNFVNKRSQP